MMRPKFITIEGTEGAGKSTALTYIKNYLSNLKIEMLTTREPGGTVIAEEIRQILLHHLSSESIQPETELLLMFAARAQHINSCIKPALATGKWVITDRYIDASYAYQGGGRGISQDHIRMLDQLVVAGLYPDLTLLFDIPPDVGLLRTEMRGLHKDRIEKEKLDFFKRVRKIYLERAEKEPNRIKIIDASQALSAVQAQIHSVLDSFMRK